MSLGGLNLHKSKTSFQTSWLGTNHFHLHYTHYIHAAYHHIVSPYSSKQCRK